MKNLFNILATLIVALFLFSFGVKSEAVAQSLACDSTWTQKKDTLTINGCEYEVDLCVQCTYAFPGKVKVNGVSKLDDSCVNTPFLTPGQVLDQVISQASNWAYVYFDVCILSGPPCDLNDPDIVEYQYPRCWFLLKDTVANRTWFIPCNDQVCEVTYEYCVELPGMNVRLTELSSKSIGGLDLECDYEGHEITYPTTHNETSECFILHTPCD